MRAEHAAEPDADVFRAVFTATRQRQVKRDGSSESSLLARLSQTPTTTKDSNKNRTTKDGGDLCSFPFFYEAVLFNFHNPQGSGYLQQET